MLGYSENRILNISTESGYEIECMYIAGKCWAVRNLDIDDGGGGIFYPNNDISNVPDYGLLYTFDAAVRIAEKTHGFVVPTLADWDALRALQGLDHPDYLCGEYVLWDDGVLRNGSLFGQSGLNLIPAASSNSLSLKTSWKKPRLSL